MSGVKLPKLGSIQDRVLRQFLLKRSSKEIKKNRVLALAAVAMAANLKNPESMVKDITDSFEDYVHMELYLENSRAEYEMSLKEEYEFWKDSRPKVNITKDGKVSLSVSSLNPKSKK